MHGLPTRQGRKKKGSRFVVTSSSRGTTMGVSFDGFHHRVSQGGWEGHDYGGGGLVF